MFRKKQWGQTLSGWSGGGPSTEERTGPGSSAEVLQSLYCGMAVIDVLAMPEVYEDMSEAEKERTEEVRVQIINRLRGFMSARIKSSCRVACFYGCILGV
jgi:hypothetical protein